MKPLSESKALITLGAIRDEFAGAIRRSYEHKAKPCATCETPGACCLDEHFVNVRITRLEAKAMGNVVETLPQGLREKVYLRIDNAIEKYSLNEHARESYACPLFEKGIGCLVHATAKPLPCIAHACYERKEDRPPDELIAEKESKIANLNERVYGQITLLPLPVLVKQILRTSL